jgi:hypothetical protein
MDNSPPHKERRTEGGPRPSGPIEPKEVFWPQLGIAMGNLTPGRLSALAMDRTWAMPCWGHETAVGGSGVFHPHRQPQDTSRTKAGRPRRPRGSGTTSIGGAACLGGNGSGVDGTGVRTGWAACGAFKWAIPFTTPAITAIGPVPSERTGAGRLDGATR